MSRSFFTLVSVFFFWGFVAASNGILIPVYKEHLHLEQWQTMLIDVAFYVAYTVGSIIYYIWSRVSGEDLLNKIGYKNGISLGLTISAVGAFLFYPAAQTESFALMITALFIIGLGFSLQQTAANPLAINIGDPAKGSQRLSLAGGINNIGSTIGPVLVSFAIFGSLASGQKLESLESVKTPYIILGFSFLIVAVLFKLSSIPNKLEHVTDTSAQNSKDVKSVFSYPQLWLGMIAIFLYVGVEVSTAANLPEYMKQKLGTKTENVSPYVSLFWASLMIGRWSGAIGAFNVKDGFKASLRFLLPYAAFGVFLLVNKNSIADHDPNQYYYYACIILVLIAADILSRGNPARQLVLFSACGITALLMGMFSTGLFSAYCFISVGLFCSTLWPCIFTLAISGLGKKTNEGSGFLIMMIMGGGLVSELQAYLSKDNLLGIQFSYFVGVFCFAYLAFYGWKAKNILLKQGINYDQNSSSGH